MRASARRRDGDETPWVAGYSNDIFGYIPSQGMFAEGGYEAYDAMAFSRTHPGPWDSSLEERIVGKVNELNRRLKAAGQLPLETQRAADIERRDFGIDEHEPVLAVAARAWIPRLSRPTSSAPSAPSSGATRVRAITEIFSPDPTLSTTPRPACCGGRVTIAPSPGRS